MKHINVIYLGVYFSEDDEINLKNTSKLGLPYAHQVLQNRLLKGFIKKLGIKRFFTLTTVPIGRYPAHATKIIYRSTKRTILGEVFNNNIGFVNFPILKEISRYYNVRKQLKVLTESKDQFVLFLYDLNISLILAALFVAHNNKNIATCLMVPDLPGKYGMKSGRKGLFYALEKPLGYLTLRLVSYFDSYVLLTKQMGEIVNPLSKPSVVVEAIVNDLLDDCEVKAVPRNKILMYAGWVKKEYNIIGMLNAFMEYNDQDARLWICGSCDFLEEFLKIINDDQRIRYYGALEKKKVDEISKDVFAFINPRLDDGLYTRYSFPSKTVEAMIFGKPLICYKLQGIPDEYDKHLIYPKDKSLHELTNTIGYVLNMKDEDYIKHCKDACHFIAQTKTVSIQLNKIFSMLHNTIDKKGWTREAFSNEFSEGGKKP